MDSELKTRWIEALRSGRYHQAQGALRKNDAYCCLGVLCNLVDPNGWDMTNALDGTFIYKGEGNTGLLPLTLARELDFIEDDHQVMYSAANDRGKSFDEIADMVENDPNL